MTVTNAQERNKATIKRVFAEFVNRGDESLVDELYRPDIVDHAGLPGAPEGAEGVKYTIAGLREAFPDFHVTIEDISAHDDMVVIHNTWRGTHLGELLGIAPTGRTLLSVGIVIWRFDEQGRIAERWEHGVSSNMFAALGLRMLAPRKGGRRTVEGTRSVTRTVPLRNGKPTAWRQLSAELQGPRRREYEASRRRLGITHEVLRVDPRPDQDHVIVHFETVDPDRTRKRWAESTHPFDQWLREQVLDIHGEDPWAGPATSYESAGLAWTAPPKLTPSDPGGPR
ncbi:ester cyclase [Paractinoplanes lichenicola]|uniref:Ester cyclase n=1 Tax=Paractinoplanes lichenicola TaxID=2802976 RepID=A0ABS1VFD8_9ACTN|nr:ester cyclase [Actinoplanes lichenicola]MBL7253412.1 ester cyclase [Actinoplanes lichenicola]